LRLRIGAVRGPTLQLPGTVSVVVVVLKDGRARIVFVDLTERQVEHVGVPERRRWQRMVEADAHEVRAGHLSERRHVGVEGPVRSAAVEKSSSSCWPVNPRSRGVGRASTFSNREILPWPSTTGVKPEQSYSANCMKALKGLSSSLHVVEITMQGGVRGAPLKRLSSVRSLAWTGCRRPTGSPSSSLGTAFRR